MPHVMVRNATRSSVLASRADVADTFRSRFFGLLPKRSLHAGEGLVIEPCSSVHSLGMRFALDIVHVDAAGTVLRLITPLAPWRLGPLVRGGRAVIELPVGTILETGTQVGDIVVWEPCVPPYRTPPGGLMVDPQCNF